MSVRTPYMSVRVEGEDVTRWVKEVTVTEDDRRADSVSLSVPDPRMIYADGLVEGSLCEIDLGYAEPNQHALMLRAVLTKIEIRYPADGVPQVKLEGEDRSILLGLEERNKVWRDMTVTEIVRAVAEPYGFARVDARLDPDPRIASRPLHQDGKTDLAFLQELAQKYHAKCFVELDERGDEILYFLPEREIVRMRRPETLKLSYRKSPRSNLMSFQPRFDGSAIDRLKQVSDVDRLGQTIESRDRPPADPGLWRLDPGRLARANARDRAALQRLHAAGTARKRDIQQRFASPRPGVGEVAPDQADIESTNDALEARSLGTTARGSTFGNIWLRAKSNVLVEGVSSRFDGEWYVSNVTHRIGGQGFKSDFQCSR